MSRQLRKSTIDKWSPYVEEFERSSLTLREFCKQEEISIKTFSNVRRCILYDRPIAVSDTERVSFESDSHVFKKAVIAADPSENELIHIRINNLDIAYPSCISKADLAFLLSACTQVC